MNKLKSILFVGISLKVGGIERALVEQVNYLANQGLNVDLYLFSHYGEYLSELSPKVKLLPENKILHYVGLTQQDARKLGKKDFFIRTLFAIIARILGSVTLYNIIFRFCAKLSGYDIAISYFQNGDLRSLYFGCNEYVLNNVKSSKKIAWIHSDYVYGKIKNTYNDEIYKKYDAVVNVSSTMKKKFDALNIVNKTNSFVVYNRFNYENCVLRSKNIINIEKTDRFLIVTVGRLEKEKGTIELFKIAKYLKKEGLDFRWIFIGTGVLANWCMNYIAENNLSDNIKLLGTNDNPYPYIAQSSLLVSGSLSETFGLTILEALILKTPVVTYAYEAVSELVNNENGYAFETFESMAQGIKKLIKDPNSYTQLYNSTKLLYDYNDLNREQITNLFEQCIYSS